MMRISRVRELNKCKAQAGFTLFELLVVISIMAILLGLAIPSLNVDSGKGAFSDFKSMLTNGISQARYIAMITGKVQTLSMENGGEIVLHPSGLYKADMPEEYEVTSIQTVDDKRERNFRVRFYPSGLAESCVIQVRRDVDEYSFYLPPISGIKGEPGRVNLESFQE